MTSLSRRKRQRQTDGKPNSYTGEITLTLVLIAGIFAILQIFSVTTQVCRDYYDWNLVNWETGQSLMQGWLGICLALSLYWIIDIFRPKRVQVAVLIRAFQFLLIASMTVVTTIQFGVLMPHTHQAEIARQTQVLLGRTPFFFVDAVWLDDGRTTEARPVRQGTTMTDVSPFAMKAGLLRCEVDRQVEALQWEQWQDSFASAIPLAITEPRRADPD